MYEASQIDSLDFLRWYALRVRSNCEKITWAHLNARGYESFLPLSLASRLLAGRRRDFQAPLIPGYVFCRFDVNRRLPILTAPGMVSIVGAGKTPLPVEDDEIAALRAIGASDLPRGPWPFLRVGQTVRVEYGALRGIEGIVVATKSGCRLVVSITLLQRSVAAEIDQSWVRPVASRKLSPARVYACG